MWSMMGSMGGMMGGGAAGGAGGGAAQGAAGAGGGGEGGGGGGMGQMGGMMQKMMKPFLDVMNAMSNSKFAHNIKGVNNIIQKLSKGDVMGGMIAFLELTGVIDMMVIAIEPLLVLLDPVRALFEIMGSAIAKELYPVMVKLIPKIMALAPQFEEFGQKIGEFVANFLETDFVPLFDKFIEIIPDLLDLFFELFMALIQFFDIIGIQDILYAIVDSSLMFLEGLADNKDIISSFITSMMDFLTTIVGNETILQDIIQASYDFLTYCIDNSDTLIDGLETLTEALDALLKIYKVLEDISNLDFTSLISGNLDLQKFFSGEGYRGQLSLGGAGGGLLNMDTTNDLLGGISNNLSRSSRSLGGSVRRLFSL